MQINISDLIDDMAQDYGADTIELRDPGITDAERILALASGRNPDYDLPAPIPVWAGKKRPARRLGRTLLIAAVIILALTVTALAVYQYGLRDTEMAQVSLTFERNEDGEQVLTTKTTSALSLNGFSDSAEYQAYQEWTAWNEAWIAENWDIYTELGVDDSYHETPDNYAAYYSASFQEQADKLDEIAEKYGLTLHTDLELVYTESQLCGALGIDDFLPDGVEAKGGYYYEDGSFHLECTTVIDGAETWITCNNNVTGSFALIFMSMPKEYEEWSYTASGGTELIMVQTPSSSFMVAGLEGSYLIVTVDAVLDAGELEALAEEIDLTALNDCFATEEARAETRERVAAYTEAQATATTTDNGDDTAAEAQAQRVMDIADVRFYNVDTVSDGLDGKRALADMGSFELTDLPEGFSLTGGGSYYKMQMHSDEIDFCVTSMTRIYSDGSLDLRTVFLDWRSYYTQDGSEKLDMETAFALYKKWYADEALTDYTVNGYEGYYRWDEFSRQVSLCWADTDRELVFAVTMNYDEGDDPADYSLEALLTMAQSMAEAESFYSAASVYITDTVRSAAEKLDTYVIVGLTADPSLGYALSTDDGYTSGDLLWSTEEQTYDEVCIAYDNGLALIYSRFWTDEDKTATDNAAAFQAMQEYLLACDTEGDAVTTGLTVGGNAAYAVDYGTRRELTWYDGEEDVIFTLVQIYEYADETLDTQQLMALGESVAKE